MPAAVDLSALTVVRGGRRVLSELDLTVPTGQVTGLLGPSGCGKSTLLRAIVGVQRITSGTVRVLGAPAGSRELRSRVGYMTQSPSVYADLSVDENLGFFARVLGVGPDAVARVRSAVDLDEFGSQVVGRLSGGQRSRVSLAVALLAEPELLVLDEPTVGLDPVLRVSLWALFARLAQGGTTVLVSSHVMDEAERCDRLLLMRDGRLIADDTPAAIKRAAGVGDVESAFLALVEQEAR
ncbi:ABC transporter ATP-binding protein [Nocardioides dubius]|uniref:ABC transporter ATP-binding protein n=1 Tax=Nocardioides dubius TaxID=317019 RepID=A0ABP4E990_9ACTN